MPTPVAKLLDHVPVTSHPATLNDARTIRVLSEGIDPRVVDWTLTIVQRSVQVVHDDIAPSRFESLAAGIARSIEAISLNLIRFLLSGRETAAAVRVSRAQREETLEAVGLGVPLPRIVGGLRTLTHVWKTAFIELVVTQSSQGLLPPEETVELLSRVDRVLSIYFDAIIDDNVQNWTDENQRLADQRAINQRRLIDRVVQGRRVGDELISSTLGVQAGDEHLGLIVSGGADEGLSSGFDFAAFRAALERTFPEQVLTFLPASADTVWVFLSASSIPENTSQRLRAVANEVPGALVSVGLPARSITGLRETHLTAQAVHNFNRMTPKAGPLVFFAEQGLLVLMMQDPELARWFVNSQVGPLLERTPLSNDLRKTLATLSDFNGSLVRTAEELYVHRNTITYRLKRIEQILGRDPLAHNVETHTALQIAALL